jgi:vacuolar iron transporter family protein
MNFNEVAYKEYRNLVLTREFAKSEKNDSYRALLNDLAQYEEKHFEFWKSLSGQDDYKVSSTVIMTYRIIRAIFGITFTLRLLEKQQSSLSDTMRAYLFENEHPRSREMEEIVHVDEVREDKLIRQFKEDRVNFIGSIVLGLNDGLIELSGALTGFSFAFRDHSTVMLAGFILGISASLSMASSAYLQARQEKGKDPQKSALFTGVAYMVVVVLLILPFLVVPVIEGSIAIMILTVMAIVAGLSFYTSVIFNRNFSQSFREMLLFSVGTAFVTFLIGSAARYFLGIEV